MKLQFKDMTIEMTADEIKSMGDNYSVLVDLFKNYVCSQVNIPVVNNVVETVQQQTEVITTTTTTQTNVNNKTLKPVIDSDSSDSESSDSESEEEEEIKPKTKVVTKKETKKPQPKKKPETPESSDYESDISSSSDDDIPTNRLNKAKTVPTIFTNNKKNVTVERIDLPF